MKRTMPTFTRTNLEEIDDSDLSPHEARVLAHYLSIGTCHEPIRTTAAHCRMSTGKTSEVRWTLAARGWLRPFGADINTFTREGYVYLMRSEGLHKIGVSKEPEQRLKTIARSLFSGVKLVHSFWSKDAYTTERKLHNRFTTKRVKGEWFDLSASDVAYIKGMK